MTHPDQPSHPASDAESVHHVYLSTDIRPAIRAATGDQTLAALAEFARHLCSHLTSSPGPAAGKSWQCYQAGSGTRAGFQLYHHALQSVAGHYLQALGLDPARAATDNDYLATTLGPFLAVSPRQLRHTLIRLVNCIDTTIRDADTTAGAADDARVSLSEEIWEVGTGVITGIGLYRHAAHVMTVHALYFVWDALEITGQPEAYRPFGDDDFLTTHLN